MPSDRTVLAVMPHPDDECWCSGLLASQVGAGLDVHLAIACNGNMGGMPNKEPDERAIVRRDEARCAAELIGAKLHWMDIGDNEIMDRYSNDYSQLESQFRDLVRRVDPHLLILPHPDDYHHHHRAVSEVAFNASVNAGNASFKSDLPPASRVPVTIYTQPMIPAPFTPHIYADISHTFERKMQALRCHKSQHPFLQDHHRTDFTALVRHIAATHGAACNTQYAEAFALCHRFNRPATIQTLAAFFPQPDQI